ncbi:zeta toxin family protein [Runella sp. MFBS21]|uniref:zeta toxin family protein n=1 Tax=Runella sp. MFBS21 TaxID=3034018 RepID=UPI0023F67D0A|nr:zeta toxin family protein [Runella sp. MFBS21]MDF7821804.1 zeta toxin family protein [Runella sp. MFBS21]
MENPKFVLVAGGNGTGKTSFIDRNEAFKDYEKILPDRINQEMRFKDAFSLSQEVAGRLEKAVAEKKNIVFEHNLHSNSMFDRLKALKTKGYETQVLFLGVDKVETQRDRVDNRVRKNEGHDVDSDTIRDRREKGFSNIKSNLGVADVTMIIDNSAKAPQVNLSFKEGMLVEKKPNLAEWVKKEFEVPLKIQEKLGVKPDENDKIKFKL